MNRNLLATAICASLLAAGAAHAQTAQNTSQGQTTQNSSQQAKKKAEKKSPHEVQTLKAVTVTGSLLKGTEFEGAIPTEVVPMKARLAAGLNTIASMIQTSASAGSSTQINGQYGGFILNGGTGVKPVSLRGLGASRTLVLLDGQRPGPAGVGNQVSVFDLNVIPRAIIQRVDIVNDGSSSIYGSDAIAGVVNLITKKRLDHATFEFFTSVPQHGGGQAYQYSFADGWNFANGNVTVAAQYELQQPILRGDRSFLNCQRARVWGPNGNRVDVPDTSILAGTSMAGCSNMYIDSVIDEEPTTADEANYPHNGRFVPNPSGVTGPLSPVPGYFLETCTNYADPNTGAPSQAGCNEVNDFPGWGDAYATVKNQNFSLYLAPDFTFQTPIGPVQWDNQILLSRRVTNNFTWRQFFPIVADDNGQSIAGTGTNGHLYLPIILFPTFDRVTVNYKYLHSMLSGGFGDSSWSWTFNVNASQSNGSNNLLGINNAQSGDNFNTSGNTLVGPTLVNYFDPSVINGTDMYKVVSALGQHAIDRTVYKQQDANLLFQGNLPFGLPAGDIAAAIGGEFRHMSLKDNPWQQTWGYSTSVGPTIGSDSDKEFYGQLGIPLIKGVPGFDNLAVTMSARRFRYNDIGKWANVWNFGLNWQIIPSFRVRGTIGTSYRAPDLFQQYQSPTTGYFSQTAIDPCIDWATASSPTVQAHCKAAGIPNNYNGNGSSAEAFTQGTTALQSETSRSKSLGVVWSPSFANLDVSVDYFDYHIFNEITQIGAAAIVNSCYSRPLYPNEFCSLFHRNPPVPGQPNAPGANQITTISNPYINLNQQRSRGYQLTAFYQKTYPFGTLSFNGSVVYNIAETQQVFSTSANSGFSTSNFLGTVGNPRWYSIFNAAWSRGDWTVNYQGIFVSRTSDHINVDPSFTYLGLAGSWMDVQAGAQYRQTASATWSDGTFEVTFGIRNFTDRKPPDISPADNVENLAGQVPLSASQYDWYGRTFFADFNVKI